VAYVSLQISSYNLILLKDLHTLVCSNEIHAH
jgi:hypothetical protein